MKTSIEAIINAMKNAVTCGAIPTNNGKTVQAHSAIEGAFKANKARHGKLPKGTITEEKWVSGDSTVNNKPSSYFSYLRRKFGAVRKNDTTVSIRTKDSGGEENHGDLTIHKNLEEWEKKQ